MNKQGINGIGWCDWTSNPVKGYCPNACPYCYARAMYDRFKWDKTIRLDQLECFTWSKAKPGEKIFVGSTIDLFGEWIPDYWMEFILGQVDRHPALTFIFLTKFPQNLAKWNPWPENCWVGATATDNNSLIGALCELKKVDSDVRFISLEPFLKPIVDDPWLCIDWLIIGAQTNPTVMPKPEWVQEIVEAADKAGIKVFLKDNLWSIFPDDEIIPIWAQMDRGKYRQEMP